MTKTERQLAEYQISCQSKSVKPEHLNHYKCIAAIRGSFYDRYRTNG